MKKLQNKVLTENTVLIVDTENFQVIGAKYKKIVNIFSKNKAKLQSFKIHPLRFIFSIFILQPDYLIQELACLLAINFEVHYLKYFILEFPIKYNQYKDQLYSLKKNIRCSRFKYKHMKNWINKAYRLRKTKDEQQCTRLKNDFIGSEIFFREFF